MQLKNRYNLFTGVLRDVTMHSNGVSSSPAPISSRSAGNGGVTSSLTSSISLSRSPSPQTSLIGSRTPTTSGSLATTSMMSLSPTQKASTSLDIMHSRSTSPTASTSSSFPLSAPSSPSRPLALLQCLSPVAAEETALRRPW